MKRFLEQLCETKVLDPACGTGNFLYVAMARMKDLEGEVRLFLRQLGEQQDTLEGFGHTVDPHQFLGIELNPRAAAIAELVLWIGYLQWQVRTGGVSRVKQPVLKAYHNIENRDAVLAYDERQLVLDELGKPVTRWDGKSTKPSPVTGEDVPDETMRVPVYRYTNPRKAEWPKADFIVGNPPFIGNKRMRELLGDEYVAPLRSANPEVPGSADFVMFWWSQAREMVHLGTVSRAGLITTNSITQSFNRQVLKKLIDDGGSISFAVADHPWVDSADGAAVRVAMAVGQKIAGAGRLLEIANESPGVSGEYALEIRETEGHINADLSLGTNSSTTISLKANAGMCLQGVIPLGQGFVISADDGARLGRDTRVGLATRIRRYRNGKDLSQRSRDAYVIDLEGLEEAEIRTRFPEVYQHILELVKPERDQNREKYRRENWWKFGRKHTDLREALEGLVRYTVTVKTAKHRVFMFLEGDVVPDSKLYAIAIDDPFSLGVLSSRSHVVWATRVGGWLGVGNDPTYNNRDCFDRFPFPLAADAQKSRIRDLGEQLDAHRKRQQAAHPGLTITNMYNVFEKLRAGEELTAKDKQVHEQGLVSLLKQIHDDLDAAVFEAYGWPAHLSDEQILERLVALNHERAAEEARGVIRWLRPEFQNRGGATVEQSAIEVPNTVEDDEEPKLSGKAKKGAKAAAPKVAKPTKLVWPKTLAEQARAVRNGLDTGGATTPAALAKAAFKGAKVDRVEEILETLVTLGQARRDESGSYRR